MVVGEHFEREDEPFTSLAGLAFKALLEDAGLPVVKLAFCHSGPATQMLLERADPEWVITSGQRALSLFHPRLLVRWAHGRPFYTQDRNRIVFPVFHHVALRRSPDEWRQDALDELQLLYKMAYLKANGGDWSSLWPVDCTVCRGEVWRYDGLGVPFCSRHWIPKSCQAEISETL